MSGTDLDATRMTLRRIYDKYEPHRHGLGIRVKVGRGLLSNKQDEARVLAADGYPIAWFSISDGLDGEAMARAFVTLLEQP